METRSGKVPLDAAGEVVPTVGEDPHTRLPGTWWFPATACSLGGSTDMGFRHISFAPEMDGHDVIDFSLGDPPSSCIPFSQLRTRSFGAQKHQFKL